MKLQNTISLSYESDKPYFCILVITSASFGMVERDNSAFRRINDCVRGDAVNIQPFLITRNASSHPCGRERVNDAPAFFILDAGVRPPVFGSSH